MALVFATGFPEVLISCLILDVEPAASGILKKNASNTPAKPRLVTFSPNVDTKKGSPKNSDIRHSVPDLR